MKQLSNVRKASAAAGDDVTFTRWVKEDARKAERRPAPLAPADATGTRFPGRVLPVTATPQLLVSGHSNIKIGRDVRVGPLTGYWIYTLSLEERTTCPSSCMHWCDCYGNSMPFAKRVDHTDPAFLPQLEAEVAQRVGTRGRVGVLVRLHALGDFYSTEYVDFWRDRLREHPTLALFGYTAWPWSSTIGQRLDLMRDEFGFRAMIRYSDGGMPRMSTASIVDESVRPPDAFICPEQLGKVDACGKCGLCWKTTHNVAFLAH